MDNTHNDNANEDEVYEIEIVFIDPIVAEVEGNFNELDEFNAEDNAELGGMADEWVYGSRMEIYTPFGMCNFDVDFYHDKKLVVKGYDPTTWEQSMNNDFVFFNSWAMASGWDRIVVADDLVQNHFDFFSEVNRLQLFYSPYLDRNSNISGSNNDDISEEYNNFHEDGDHFMKGY